MAEEPEFIPAKFHETADALVLTDREGRILWMNPGFTILCGYELPEVKGKKPGSFLQGPKTEPEVVQNVREAIHAGIGCVVELTNYHKDGHSYLVHIEISPIKDKQGRPTFFAAIEREFTPNELSVGTDTLRAALHSILEDFVNSLRKNL